MMFQFYEAYLEKDYMGYINIMYSIKTAYSFDQFLVSLTNFTVRGIYILNGVNVDGISREEISEYMDLFKKVSPAQVSSILSSLRSMRVGDLEANFMSFIYCQEDRAHMGTDGNPVAITMQTDSTTEQKYRNDNLQRIEDAKLRKGAQGLSTAMEEVGFEGLGDLFSLEKVK